MSLVQNMSGFVDFGSMVLGLSSFLWLVRRLAVIGKERCYPNGSKYLYSTCICI